MPYMFDNVCKLSCNLENYGYELMERLYLVIIKENFIYDGTAFFRDDKLVATISDINDQILQLLNNDYHLELLPIPSLAVSLGQIRAKVNIEIEEFEEQIFNVLVEKIEILTPTHFVFELKWDEGGGNSKTIFYPSNMLGG